MVWRHLVSVLLAVFLGAAAAGPARAQASDVTAALTEASKLMQKGGYLKAIETIDYAMRAGKVPSDLAAKALLMRAEANEKLGRAAFAFADYNSALWMQGLSESDRKRAEAGHARVQKSLGVASEAGADAPQTEAVREQPSEQRTGGTGGIGGFFSNLFSPSKPREAPPPTAAAVVTAPAEPPAPPQAQPQARPAPKKAAGQQHAQAAPRPTPAATAKPSESGNFAIQLAAVAEEDKAIAEADRLAKRYRDDLGGRTPSLMIVPTADGGTLYKIVLAPYETRGEGLAACELLKTKGLSCMVISKK
jgi:cell division septation protein DedD